MFAIALVLNLIFFGTFLSYLFKFKLLFEERILLGLLIGLISLGYMMLFLAYIFGLNFISFFIFLTLINCVSILIVTKRSIKFLKSDFQEFRARTKELSWKAFYLSVSLFIIIFGYLAHELLTFSNGSYFVQPIHAFGDISLHLGIISSFAFGNNFPVQNPILNNTPISYPFLFDFITSIFVNPLGLSLDKAVSLTGILGMAMIILSLAYFVLHLTKSKLSAILFLILFFFMGGLGFIYFFQDYFASGLPFIEFITNLERDYTAMKDMGFYWINVVLMMLLPQRSFLLGLPLSIMIIRLFWELSKIFSLRGFILGVLLTSALPIIHAHSLIAIAPILVWFTLVIIKRNKLVLPKIFITCLIGGIMIFFLSKIFLQQAISPFALIKLQLGWMAGQENILIYYLKNFGIILIILPVILWLGFKQRWPMIFLVSIGQVWFILPSIFIFQPWDFDNTKLFIYWYILSAILIAYFLAKIILSKQIISRFLAIFLIVALTFSGMLDIFRLLSGSGTKYTIYSKEALELANFVRENTDKHSVFLSIDKFDNPILALAGRKTVVGFHAWLWTYGIDFSQREIDVRQMFAGDTTNKLFKKYNVTHIILFFDPTNIVINRDYFDKNFTLIYNKSGYVIYKI